MLLLIEKMTLTTMSMTLFCSITPPQAVNCQQTRGPKWKYIGDLIGKKISQCTKIQINFSQQCIHMSEFKFDNLVNVLESKRKVVTLNNP